MFDYTLFTPLDEEFDWLAAAIECADHTPLVYRPPLTANELLLIKLRHRMHSHNYRQRHPDKVKARSRLRQKRNSFNDATAQDVELQLKTQRNKCWWCGKKLTDVYHIDHRVPLAKGGSNGVGNIVISCPKCNLKKQGKMPFEFNGRLL